MLGGEQLNGVGQRRVIHQSVVEDEMLVVGAEKPPIQRRPADDQPRADHNRRTQQPVAPLRSSFRMV